jgi:hypothetical protein
MRAPKLEVPFDSNWSAWWNGRTWKPAGLQMGGWRFGPAIADARASAFVRDSAVGSRHPVRARAGGSRGVDWHIRPGFENAPFSLGTRDGAVRPELYAIAIFAQTDAPRAGMLNVVYHTAGSGVRIWVIADRNRRTAVLINETRGRATISLRIPNGRGGWLRTLVADPLSYGGRWIGGDGRWHGPLRQLWIPRREDGSYLMTLSPLSAGTFVSVVDSDVRRRRSPDCGAELPSVSGRRRETRLISRPTI